MELLFWSLVWFSFDAVSSLAGEPSFSVFSFFEIVSMVASSFLRFLCALVGEAFAFAGEISGSVSMFDE